MDFETEFSLLRKIPETTIFLLEKNDIGKNIDGHVFKYKYLLVNDFLASILGKKPEDIEGKYIPEIFPELKDKIISSEKKYDIQLENNDELEYPQKININKVGLREFFIHTRVYTFPGGKKVIYGAGKDITEIFTMKRKIENQNYNLKELNEEIATQNEEISSQNETLILTNELLGQVNQKLKTEKKTMEKILSIANHDIKGSIGSLLQYIELFPDGIPPEDTKIISKGIKKVHLFAKDILGILKVSSDHPAKKETFDTQTFFEDIQEYAYECLNNQQILYTNKALKKKEIILDFDTHIPELLQDCLSDTMLLRSLFTNLLSNAIKFTQEGSIMFFAVVEKQDYHKRHIRFFVQDTGTGISPEHLPTLFESLSTSIDIPKDEIQRSFSTGAGLHNCKVCAEKLGGTINVESEVGKGTTFIVDIPFEIYDKDKSLDI